MTPFGDVVPERRMAARVRAAGHVGEPVHAGCIGVDTNDDHYAAWRLDEHGNPIGRPRRFSYDMSGRADHRDAQIRHATTRLLHWAEQVGAGAVAIENLDFSDGKTRESTGDESFRRLISRFPTVIRSRGTPRGVKMGAGCPPTPVRSLGLDPVQQSGVGARPEGSHTVASSTPVRNSALTRFS